MILMLMETATWELMPSLLQSLEQEERLQQDLLCLHSLSSSLFVVFVEDLVGKSLPMECAVCIIFAMFRSYFNDFTGPSTAASREYTRNEIISTKLAVFIVAIPIV